MDDGEFFQTCRHCGKRIELIRFSMGPEWRHWPTVYGNHTTREKYRHCRQQVAEPANQQVPKCDRCGQPVEPHDFGPTIDGSPVIRWASIGPRKFCDPHPAYHRVNGSAYPANQQVPGGER